MPSKDIEDKAKDAFKFAKSYNEYIEYFDKIKKQLYEGFDLYIQLSENDELSELQRKEALRYAHQLAQFSESIPEIKSKSLDVSSVNINRIGDYSDNELQEYYESIYYNRDA